MSKENELRTACLPASRKALPNIREPVRKIWTITLGEDCKRRVSRDNSGHARRKVPSRQARGKKLPVGTCSRHNFAAQSRVHPSEMVQHTVIQSRKRKASHNAHPQSSTHQKASSSDFLIVNASMVVSIPPVFSRNPRVGVQEMLDGMLMRYIPSLGGVALSHSNLQFATRSAAILADCPFLVCDVVFDATVWYPKLGMRLVGKINLCSPDHISLLVHRTFNVSIPRHHIPTDKWAFEYGPAENDPEFGSGAQTNLDQEKSDDSGRWLHRLTAEPLGGQDGYIEFTVVGFTVANEMLSLLGSIQPDPFSPLHVPQNKPPQSHSVHADEDEVQTDSLAALGSDIEAEYANDEDTFAYLGWKADEAANKHTKKSKKARLEKETVEEAQKTKTRKKRERKTS
ncbi:hypothetical protein BDN72DRAFT_509171 [Pluteus cervinus]|uniref:Uncharacterized protein n=1 Tax=Pluteus cervinus TaxID=181527 RepID=A0ACD3BAC1_9AGAR|nr:hypothetical protein BDN72DRAFT_509171 [Pluteus cervinus]